MEVGDKVTHITGSAKGTVSAVDDDAVAVTWKLGSGWNWSIWHQINELKKEEGK